MQTNILYILYAYYIYIYTNSIFFPNIVVVIMYHIILFFFFLNSTQYIMRILQE